MYEFVTGPLAWLAFLIFIIGITIKAISAIRLAKKKDKVVFNHWSWGWSLRSIFHWLIPLGSVSSREKPVTSIAIWLFHACLLAVPIFLLGHNILWDERWGISWWTFSEMTTDYLTLLFFAAPFATGYFAYHQWLLDYKTMLIIHILCGQIMLVAIPFTKLGHMVLFFFTRAHIGSEMGQRRGAKTW
jgi:hypothetical protein